MIELTNTYQTELPSHRRLESLVKLREHNLHYLEARSDGDGTDKK